MDSFEINPENINTRQDRDNDPSTLRSTGDTASRTPRTRPRIRVDYGDGFRTPAPGDLSQPDIIRPLRAEEEPQPAVDTAAPQPTVNSAEAAYTPQAVEQQPRRDETIHTPQASTRPAHEQSPEQKHPNVATLARFFADGRLRIFFGVLLILAAAYMLAASISFLTHGPADQSIVANSTASEIAAGPHDVENTAGWFGAFLSNLLMYRWLGLGGFIIIFYICALGISLVRLHHFRFWQLTFKSLVASIAVSIIAGFATYSMVSPTFWGGEHGYWVNHGIISAASFWGGAGVTILMLTALTLIFIGPIRRSLSFIKMLIANRKRAIAERYHSSMAAAKAAVKQERENREQHDRHDMDSHADSANNETATIQPSETQPDPEPIPEPEEPHRVAPRPISVSVTAPEDNPIEVAQERIIDPVKSEPLEIHTPQPVEETIIEPQIPADEPEPEEQEPSEIVAPEAPAADDQPKRPMVAFDLTEIETQPAPSHEAAPRTLNDRYAARFDLGETSSNTDLPSSQPGGQQTESNPRREIVAEVTAAPPIATTDEPASPADRSNLTAEDVLNSEQYDPRADLSRYRFPGIDLLHHRESNYVLSPEEQEENNQRIISTLDAYGIKIESIKATVGPTITLYEIVPQTGTRISSIKRLGDDMALSLSAIGIRIIAPIPGKGTIGMEVPNKKPQIVGIRSILSSKAFNESSAALPIALGTTIDNEVYVADLAKMPHLLVAGATGMGKSVGLNTIIASLLYKKHPAELKFVLVDPKMVEFSLYKCLERHFLAKLPEEEEPIITDPQKVVATLNSLCLEMDNRYALLSKAGMRGIKEYNQKFMSRRLNPEKGHRYLPYIVVIIDEFGDLILTAGKEVENPISRIAAKARAVGIHMILATQRPSVNVITGVIKANFPGRMAFRVTQMNDSRTILDRPGAEQLIGRGDMLISRDGVIDRVQCAFIDTDEVEAVCDYISDQMGYPTSYELPEEPAPQGDGAIRGALTDRDPMFADAGRAVIEAGMGSASLLQRKFNIGYPRAGKLIDQLEAAGVVGSSTGAGKPRPVLLDSYSFERMLEP